MNIKKEEQEIRKRQKKIDDCGDDEAMGEGSSKNNTGEGTYKKERKKQKKGITLI